MTHKVADEKVSGPGSRNMMYVTLTCTCRQAFGGGARWQIRTEERASAIDRARRKAETAFREHLEIR